MERLKSLIKPIIPASHIFKINEFINAEKKYK